MRRIYNSGLVVMVGESRKIEVWVLLLLLLGVLAGNMVWIYRLVANQVFPYAQLTELGKSAHEKEGDSGSGETGKAPTGKS